MVNRIDLQLDNNTILIQNNDFVLVESDDQHVVDTINACPGWWKENPTDGVAIIAYLKGKGIEQELSRKMKLNLQSDNYISSPSISYDGNTLIINPNVSI